MAIDDSYDEILPDLINKYHCTKRFPKKPTRYDFWTRLLHRWSTGAFDAVSMVGNNREMLPAIKLINHYQHEYRTGTFNKKDPIFFEQTGTGKPFLRLDEFKEYLDDYAGIPLPCSIFPIDNSVKESDRSILQYGSAAQRLYDRMVKCLRSRSKTLTLATAEDRKDAAVSEFDANPDYFSPLKKNHIDIPGPYEANEKYSRKMIGTIIMSANIPGVESNYQELYSRFQSLKPSK
jgi:hypothetical protein